MGISSTLEKNDQKNGFLFQNKLDAAKQKYSAPFRRSGCKWQLLKINAYINFFV